MRRSKASRSGFTLIELVVSSALMSVILASAYLCLRAGLLGRELIEQRSDTAQHARVALDRISADLRSANPLSGDNAFLGMSRMLGEMEADNLDFATHHYTPRGPREGDFAEVSYYLDANRETGGFSLWRRRDPTPDLQPLQGGSREEIATGLRGLKFEYYDGFLWYDDWGDPSGQRKQQTSQTIAYNLYGLPEAVRITLLFAPDSSRAPAGPGVEGEEKEEAPMVFQTVVRLNLAGRYLMNSSSGSASSSAGSSAQGGNY